MIYSAAASVAFTAGMFVTHLVLHDEEESIQQYEESSESECAVQGKRS